MLDKFKYPVKDTDDEVDEEYYQDESWSDYDPYEAEDYDEEALDIIQKLEDAKLLDSFAQL